MVLNDHLKELLKLKEHNRLEAKSAKGGFPGSFWETYSAFANTDGGLILLGVKEDKDGNLHPEDVDVEKLQKDFWNMVNNRQKISANIVTDRMVKVEDFDGHKILVVEVPRAERSARPVYVGMDPKSGTYRRNHEGDYHCSLEEVSLMFRDAAAFTQDSKVLENMDLTVFCKDTVRGYRNFFRSKHSNHLWNNEDDEMFLRKIGAISIGTDGKYHPTAAGLLMFGYEYEITREFPNYFLDYQENRSLGSTRWTDRLVSTSGDWSGNVFDFVIEALRRMQHGFKVPFVLQGNTRVDDTPIHKLLREAITNACVHADFYGRQGLVIQKSEEGFTFSNPGTIRISVTEAVNGGISDPRNGIMLKMFSLIDFGERAGSGLSGICKVWEKVFHTPASVVETHKNGVDRTVLTLSTGGNEQDIKAMLELYGIRRDGVNDEVITPNNDANKHDDHQNDPQKGNGVGNGVENDPQKVIGVEIGVENGVENDPQKENGVESDVEKLLSEREYKIYILLNSDSSLSASNIQKRLQIPHRTVQRDLHNMQMKGVLKREGSDRGGRWIILK